MSFEKYGSRLEKINRLKAAQSKLKQETKDNKQAKEDTTKC